jgi:hypothetical protein
VKLIIEIKNESVIDYIRRADITHWGKMVSFNAKTMSLVVDDDLGEKVMRADRETIEIGVARLAKELPHHFCDMVMDKGDAITGNYLVQMIMFGEIEYE